MTRDQAIEKLLAGGLNASVHGAKFFVDSLICLDILKVEEPLKKEAHELARQALVGGGCAFTEASMHIHNIEAAGLEIVKK